MTQFSKPASDLAIVILAAGKGTRMKSRLPKMLHKTAGRPMVEQVVRTAQALKPHKIVVIVGVGQADVRAALADYEVEFAVQEEQLGTGHAFMQAHEALKDFQGVSMCLNSDGPLLKADTLKAMWQKQVDSGAGMAVITCNVANPTGLGRIVRDEAGNVLRIVEHKDANEAERAITEVNTGYFSFDSNVFAYSQELSDDNAGGEYYITDLLAIYRQQGQSVAPYEVEDEREVLGVNNRLQLAQVDMILRQRIREQWLLAGVTMIDPESIYIDDTVTIENDVIIYPNVHLQGATVVRSGVVIPPNVVIRDTEVTLEMTLQPFTSVGEAQW